MLRPAARPARTMLLKRLWAERRRRVLPGEPFDIDGRLLPRRASRRRPGKGSMPAFDDAHGIDDVRRSMLREGRHPHRGRRLLPGRPGDDDRNLLPRRREGRRARDLRAGVSAKADTDPDPHADDRDADDPGMRFGSDRGRRRLLPCCDGLRGLERCAAMLSAGATRQRRMRRPAPKAALPTGLRRSRGRFLLSGRAGRPRRANLLGVDDHADDSAALVRGVPDWRGAGCVRQLPDERSSSRLPGRQTARPARKLRWAASPRLPERRNAGPARPLRGAFSHLVPDRRDNRFDGPLRCRGASLAAEDPGDAAGRAVPSSRRDKAPATRLRGRA